MFPKIMKWVSLAALVLAIGVRQFATNYSVLPQLVIFVGACVIALQGIHEYELEFDYGATRSIASAASDDRAGGSVFTAVQEQLGLKLERRRETTDVLVIDSLELPSEN